MVSQPGVVSYPKTRREEVRETVGGIEVADPYRWLEDDVAAGEWDAAQNALSSDFIEGWEHYDALRAAMAVPLVRFPGGMAASSALGPFRCGGRWLRFGLRGDDFPVLELAEEPFGAGSVAFDPDRLPEGLPRWLRWAQASPDGRLVALCFMRDAGAREPDVLRVLDLESGELLPDEIESIHGPGGDQLVWLPDSSGFFYLGQDVLAGPPRWRPGFVAFHRVGSGSEGEPVLPIEHSIIALHASPDHRYVTVVQGFASPRATYIRDMKGDGGWQPFLSDVVGRAYGAFEGDCYISVFVEDAPKGRVVSIPIATATDRSTWTELVPEGEKVVWSVDVIEETLVVGLLDDAGQELHLYELDGAPRVTVPLEPGGITSPLSARGVSEFPGGFMFWHNTFTTLPAAYRWDLAEGKLSTLVPAPQTPEIEMRVLDCKARDGVDLRVRVMYRPGLDLSEPRPLLLSGYANLNKAFVFPAVGWGAFLDAGGIYAWATMPGGAEFGVGWWRMANQQKIGRRGHDLASVAEFLIAEGYTTSEQLAITGASGGGVLTAMAITERPDLYKAAAILCPQTDFVRYINEPYGRSWVVHEWGDPEDPEDAPIIQEWSPVHNVREGERYPATLLFVGTEDGICPPWHSRKLVAELQNTGSPEPVFFRSVPGLSHGAAEATGTKAMAEQPLAFIMRALGMTPHVPPSE